MFKYYNPQLIHSKRSYTVEKLCHVFRDKKLHAQTIRAWINSGELEVISNKPIVIYGALVKEFLKKRNDAHKKTLEFNQIKCVGCKAIAVPKNNEVTVIGQNKNGSWSAVVICQFCARENTRFYGKNQRDKLNEVFIVKQTDLVTLCNKPDTASKTHLNDENKLALCESDSNQQENSLSSASKTNIGEQLTLFNF
jgi:hypothetical protein